MSVDYATCATAVCRATATHRVFWPGRDPLGMCEACARRAQRISAAMSFHLVIEPTMLPQGTSL